MRYSIDRPTAILAAVVLIVLFGGLLISYFAVPSMVSQFAAAVPDMAFFR